MPASPSYTSLTAGALAAILMLSSTAARADAASALHTFYGNMDRIGMSVGLAEKDARAGVTPVRGVYVLTTSSGKFAGYFNEAGTLFGDGRALQVLPAAHGQKLRAMTPQEVADFRAEIMNGLDYDQLIKVDYGTGNARKQLMFSAVDCGYCQKLEKALDMPGGQINTTLYVVPASLKDLNQGRAQWQTVAAIGCADDRGQAWKTYWRTLKTPAAPRCEVDAKAAEARYTQLLDIFRTAGIKVHGTPTFVREDGVVVQTKEVSKPGQIFGMEGAVPVPANPQQWLVAGVAPAAGEAAAAPQQQQGQPKKIKLNDALKSLFN